MKKLLIILIMTAFIVGSGGLLLPSPANAHKVDAGTVIKGKDLSTLYYVGEDNKRYVFPNAKTYFSWFDNFNNVEEVDNEDLSGYQLGGNVRYKPGKFLVKIQTDPKVYAVGSNGSLRWVKTESLARALYGSNWNILVDDVPDSFFGNYHVVSVIENEDEYDPEEEEDELPTISHNRGFKPRLKAQRQADLQERKCLRLEKFISRVQKKLERWGIEANDLGSDYLEQCFDDDFDDDDEDGDDDDDDDDDDKKHKKHKKRWKWHKKGKITICHIPDDNPENAHTIVVSKNAAKAHLVHSDYLGECTLDNGAVLEISNVNDNVSTTSAIISWDTNKDSDSVVEYALSPLDVASTTMTVSDANLLSSHELTLPSLTSSTTYYYIVRSSTVDEDATSGENTFTTDEEEVVFEPLEISNIIVTANATTTTIAWDTSKDASSKIEYALESLSTATSSLIVSDAVLKTSHSILLESLTASTTYYYIIESDAGGGDTATTTEETFVTL